MAQNNELRVLRKKAATLLDEGQSQTQIGRLLGKSKYSICRTVKWLTGHGYMVETAGSITKFYKLTKAGHEWLESVELRVAPYGKKEAATRGAHDLYLKYPIANPEDIGKLPGSFWDKSWRVRNGVKRSKYLDKPIRMTITLNQGYKTISAQLHDFEVLDNLTTQTMIFRTSWTLLRMFSNHGVIVDVDNFSVRNIHMTYEDEHSRKAGRENQRYKVFLGRDREKFTPKDPAQPAYAEMDGTPGLNRESNCKQHDYLTAIMPESLDHVRELLQGSVPTQLANSNALMMIAAAQKTQTDILAGMEEKAPKKARSMRQTFDKGTMITW